MSLLVIDNGTKYLRELVETIEGFGIRPDVRTSPAAIRAGAPGGVIIAGGRAHLFAPGEAAAVMITAAELEAAGCPVLGICLGHQIVGRAYGAAVAPLPADVEQLALVEVQPDPLFAGLRPALVVQLSHSDAIVSIHSPLVSLGRAPGGYHLAIRHTSLPIYGLQFHPEVSGEPGRRILANFVQLCGAAASLGDGVPA